MQRLIADIRLGMAAPSGGHADGPVADLPRRMPIRRAPESGFSDGHHAPIATVAIPRAEGTLADRADGGPPHGLEFHGRRRRVPLVSVAH
jgi:hypothetical protein